MKRLERVASRMRAGGRAVPDLARIIHECFYSNRRYATATSLAQGVVRPGGQARLSEPRHTVSSMPRFFKALRARLVSRLDGFVTNHHE